MFAWKPSIIEKCVNSNIHVMVFHIAFKIKIAFIFSLHFFFFILSLRFVYVSLLQYMEQLLGHGEFMEFFLEGGRSRSGKALQPKGGLLSVVVDSLNSGTFSN